MIPKSHNIPSLFIHLSDMLNQSHPLYKLADKINWSLFEKSFTPLYSQDNGHPGKPIRLMCGLLILKHLRNLSDESIVEQWNLAGNRGYRSRKEINGTRILIPDVPKRTDSHYRRKKKHGLFCKRAGIELTIGHLKSDYRLGRNFYKGVAGDAVNILLAAAAYNFKRAMKALLSLLTKFSEILVYDNVSLVWTF